MRKNDFLDGRVFRLKVDGAVQPILYKFVYDPDGGMGSVAWVLPDGRLEIKALITDHNPQGVRAAASFFGNRVEAFLFFDNMVADPFRG